MIRLLRIRNFAIIDEVELEFHRGFNAITGETGAGKSILLEALGLILGNRANTEVIRDGFEEATVEAVFDAFQSENLEAKLKAKGISFESELIVKRTIHRNGKNKIFINGELVTLAQLAEICENLVDLCSQHENQSLIKSSFQLDLLDRYGGLLQKRREVREVYSALRSREGELDLLTSNDKSQARNESFLRFQLTEIDQFGLKAGEEESLVAERKKLLNSAHLIEAVSDVLQILNGNDSSEVESIRQLMVRAAQRLNKACELDSDLQRISDSLDRALIELEEASTSLDSYASSIELDSSRLETIEDRLTSWAELKRKYGSSFEEVLETRTQIEKELSEYSHKEARIREISTTIDLLKADFKKTAQELSKKRKNIAKALAETIEKELTELMMADAQFKVELEATPESWTSDGIDRVQFMFSPNLGESLKPIGKIASGGELSRVMLSIRRTIADRGGIGVYVFDEIDAGIGGKTASVVGKKLQSVSKFNQVICVTHLPQVAAFADTHFSVTKTASEGRTTSQISALTDSKRVEEISRMLGGLDITEKSRAHARELLKSAR